MNLIVAADKNWGIGYKNQLLTKIPKDMEFFSDITSHNVVVMGRKTLESLPYHQPLRHRVNVVLTRNKDYTTNGAYVVHSVQELYDLIYDTLELENTDNVFIIGGESIYKEFIDDCDTAYVTKIHSEFKADTYFPNLDIQENWKLDTKSEMRKYKDLKYQFCTYKRV